MDIVGPLPVSADCRYVLAVIDRFTRWPEVYPIVDISAETCARAFIAVWVSRFGCQHRITTDRGRQFESKLFSTISALLGAQHRPTTAYHPACNGLVERLHRQLKAAIKCHYKCATANWTEVLPLVLLGIRSAWKDDVKASAAEMVYGEPLRLPGEFFNPTSPGMVDFTDFAARLRLHIAKLSPEPGNRHGQKAFYIPRNLGKANYVFLRQDGVRRPLDPPYSGPHKVLQRNNKTFRIAVQGRETTVSIDAAPPDVVVEKRTSSGRLVHFPDYYRP